MKKKIIKYLFCFLVFAFIMQVELLSQPIFDNVAIPGSLGVQIKGDNVQDLDRIQELGLKWVRRRFSWEAIEKVKGEYDFSSYDKFVNDCTERGLSIIGCMAFSHMSYGHVKDEPARLGYAKWAVALAERYKDYDNIVWEIWNEPNTMTFWGKHGGVGNSPQYANEYTNLVKAVVSAMKDADPSCVIAAGSVSNLWSESYKWMSYCFSSEGMLGVDWDVWSVHPYGLKGPEDYIDAYAYSRGLMKETDGNTGRLWINSERGFSLKQGEGWVGGNEEYALEYQAWQLVRQYLIDLLEGMPVTIWYEWSGTESFAMYTGRADHPAFMACRTMIEQLRGYSLEERIPVSKEQDFVLQFKNAEGKTKLVAWAAPPKNQDQGSIMDHTMRLSVDTTKPAAVLCDLYGVKSNLAVTAGRIIIPMTGSPVYIDFDEEPVSSIPEHISSETTVSISFNPLADMLTISSPETIFGEITIYHVSGVVAYQYIGDIDKISIDMNHFSSGAYVVNVCNKNNHSINTQKILK